MLNRVCLVGRLTRDPELRTTASGMQVVSFTIAVDDPYARKNQPQQGQQQPANSNEGTLFMSCSMFGNRAPNVAKFTKKGSLVSVEGRLRQRKYTNRDGVNVTVIETVADGVEFLEPKSAQAGRDADTGYSNQSYENQQQGSNLGSIDITDDDMPLEDDIPF